MKSQHILCVFFSFLTYTNSLYAGFYKCINPATGEVTYSGSKCAGGDDTRSMSMSESKGKNQLAQETNANEADVTELSSYEEITNKLNELFERQKKASSYDEMNEIQKQIDEVNAKLSRKAEDKAEKDLQKLLNSEITETIGGIEESDYLRSYCDRFFSKRMQSMMPACLDKAKTLMEWADLFFEKCLVTTTSRKVSKLGFDEGYVHKIENKCKLDLYLKYRCVDQGQERNKSYRNEKERIDDCAHTNIECGKDNSAQIIFISNREYNDERILLPTGASTTVSNPSGFDLSKYTCGYKK